MCGIFGYAGVIHKDKYESAFKLLRQLGRESEVRGVDSTGFSCKFHETERIVTDKMPFRATVFDSASHKFKRLRKKMPELFIGHTRLGTGSSPIINNNNHPLYGEFYHMVHNGVIPSWRNIQKENKLVMNSETDSEVIIRVMEQARSSGKRTNDAVEETLSKVWGNMAVALLDKESPYIWLFRNDNPIHIFQIPKHVFGQEMYFFASLSTIFDDAWKSVFGKRFEKDGVESVYLQQNKLYSISPISKFIKGEGWHRFVVYHISVKNRFEKSRQYSSNNVRSTKFYNQTHFWSTVIDVEKPQLGLDISDEDVAAIRSKLAEKDGKEKIKIDGLSPVEFGGLRTLVDDLYKAEMKHEMSKRIIISNAEDINKFANKTDGTKPKTKPTPADVIRDAHKDISRIYGTGVYG